MTNNKTTTWTRIKKDSWLDVEALPPGAVPKGRSMWQRMLMILALIVLVVLAVRGLMV